MKTLTETVMILECLLFWAVALPLAGLWELGVVVADRLNEHHSQGLATTLVH